MLYLQDCVETSLIHDSDKSLCLYIHSFIAKALWVQEAEVFYPEARYYTGLPN